MKLVPIKFSEVEENKAILTLQLQSDKDVSLSTFNVDYFIRPEEDPECCGWPVMMFEGKEVHLDVDWVKGEITSQVIDFDERNGG